MYKYILHVNIQAYKFLHLVISNYFHLLSFLFIFRTSEVAAAPVMQFGLFSSYSCAGRYLQAKLCALVTLVVLRL